MYWKIFREVDVMQAIPLFASSLSVMLRDQSSEQCEW